jgi:hypothetical protein
MLEKQEIVKIVKKIKKKLKFFFPRTTNISFFVGVTEIFLFPKSNYYQCRAPYPEMRIGQREN